MSYSYKSYPGSSSRRFAARGSRSQSNNRYKRGESTIDPSKFVKVASVSTKEIYTPQYTFQDFAIHDLLKANLAFKGFVAPSPIQDQAIPFALEGRDVIGIASTGTGKTVAFALPVLHKLLSDKAAHALIIAPTRELAEQIEQECKQLAKDSGLTGTLLIGGTNMGGQLRDLRSKPRIVIGTPGRIKDHLERRTLNLSNFNMVVLDEVDRMLDMGFVSDVTEILGKASSQRQSFFFSATIDYRVRTLIDTFTTDAHQISLKASSSSDNVHQDIVRYQASNEKIEKLHDILNNQSVAKVIVFDETQRSVERLSNELADRGFSVSAIHGGKTQSQRQRALARFKSNEITVLIATDVAARGIDVLDVTHVINYSAPKAYEDYIHRIGRTGRAGKVGYALTFVAAR
jgi:superfamily II DNA/RNA helicase